MNRVIRGAGSGPFIVGWVIIGLGVALGALTLMLLVLLDSPAMVFLFFAPLLLIIAGVLNLWAAQRARLEITATGFTWCGFQGAPRFLAWQDIWRIHLPVAGSRPRLVVVAQLRSGQLVEVDALWVPARASMSRLSPAALSEARQALIDGHRAHLSRAGRA